MMLVFQEKGYYSMLPRKLLVGMKAKHLSIASSLERSKASLLDSEPLNGGDSILFYGMLHFGLNKDWNGTKGVCYSLTPPAGS